MKVVDFHCDLLSYLALDRSKEAPLNPISNCSLKQLNAGHVVLQTLAVFAQTREGSTIEAETQIRQYYEMLQNHRTQCAPFGAFNKDLDKVHFILAIENGSALVEETEPLDKCFERFDQESWLYVSLTWNEENRFGGGNHSTVGLKPDGKHLLEYMDGKGVAIDFSHTSVALAHDILNHIHKKGLKIFPMASHSNFRKIKDHPRNLPNEIAKEIGSMGGVVGINFVRAFIGDKREDFLSHIQHGLKLIGDDHICLGSDFFGGIPVEGLEHLMPFFQKDFSNASTFPAFITFLEGTLSSDQIKKLAYENALIFIEKLKGKVDEL